MVKMGNAIDRDDVATIQQMVTQGGIDVNAVIYVSIIKYSLIKIQLDSLKIGNLKKEYGS